MGVVVHDQNEHMFNISVAGVQTVANDLAVVTMPWPGVIRGILARLDTAGTVSGTQITDIKKNGTSIFSGATKLNFAAASKSPTYGAFTTNPTVVAAGDTLTLHTTAVNGTPGKNLSVLITVRRARASSQGTDTDSVSATSDAV